MKTAVDPLQPRLFDPFHGLFGPIGLKRLAQGWQSLFRAILLALMPVKQLGEHFDPLIGRPTKELYAIAGLVFLQEAFNWTHEQALDAYLFRTDVQFALNVEPGSDMCLRTFERYRALFLEDDLAAQVMNDVTLKLVHELDLNIDRQRLDSTHIFSDMATFGRTRMMAITNKRFIVQVQRHQPNDFKALPEALRQRYAPSQTKLFSTKGMSAEQRTKNRQQVAEDMRDLINRFADHAGLNTRPSYQAMVTVFSQQCEIVNDVIVVKAKTGGNCVQNPSDMDATYDGCKGPGHKAQLVETCSEENSVQLIIAALPQTAVESDTSALEPVLADLKEKGLLPEEMMADTSYGSDENVQHAATLGVELVAPMPGTGSAESPPSTVESSTMPNTTPIATESGDGPEAKDASTPSPPSTPTTPTPAGIPMSVPLELKDVPETTGVDTPMSVPLEKLTIEDFAVDERTGKVEACPSGRIPLKVLYNQGARQDQTTIEMNAADCEQCPFREACPIEKTKRGRYTVKYTTKQRRQEERRREENTEAFRKRYAWRAGVESTNSGLKGKHGLGELRVRGSPAVRHAVYMKVSGWNLCRATASGLLTSRVAKILAKLGFGAMGCWYFILYCVIRRVQQPCWAQVTPQRA